MKVEKAKCSKLIVGPLITVESIKCKDKKKPAVREERVNKYM